MTSIRTIGYVRCSSLEQANEGMSLQAQCSRIAAWSEATGAEVLDVVEDAGVSGGRPLAERPGGRQIADLLSQRKPRVDAIVIVRLDRLGRDAAETLAYMRRFAQGSVGLVSITDRVDLSTPQGRAMAGVAAVFSELERALIGQRTSEALLSLRGQGRVYGPVPYGYRSEGGRLQQDADEQAPLRRLLQLRAGGASYASLAETFNEEKIPSKRGGQWHAMSVRSVIRTAENLDID